jgi:hypothetical protein
MIKIWVPKVLMKTSGEKMKISLGFVYFSCHDNHYTIKMIIEIITHILKLSI